MPRRLLLVPPKKNSELLPAPRARATSVRSPVAHPQRANVKAPLDATPSSWFPQSHITAASPIYHRYAPRRRRRDARPARSSPPEGRKRATVDTGPSAALVGSTATVLMVEAPPGQHTVFGRPRCWPVA